MWYYKRTEPTLWTVGYDGANGWTTDSDHDSRKAAAERVAYLNGHGGNSDESLLLWSQKVYEYLCGDTNGFSDADRRYMLRTMAPDVVKSN